MTKNKPKLTDSRAAFKPFIHDWAYALWLKHESVHWIHSVVPMQQDIKDYKQNLTKPQQKFLTQIFRLFTQGDIDVAGAYVDNYLPVFPQPEIRMMLLGFASREAVHIAAYSHLLETLGFDDSVYNEFLQYEEMAAKHEFFKEITGTDSNQIVQQMCAVSAFTEGMQLFSSFVMLLNFGRNNLMPGMTKIVTWSVIDESLHLEGMTRLFREFIKENRDIWTADLKKQLYSIAERMVELEDGFINLAYGVMDGSEFNLPLLKKDMHQYIRYIADRRLIALGLKGIFKQKKNPLNWVDEMLVLPSHSNFFEQEESSYSKGALTGSWSDVWGVVSEKVESVDV
ncbi:MAG: ribonucleotide-diphosphate reductase subunit beta [Nitrososphaeraceae archaeon]